MMKHFFITTVVLGLLAGCGDSSAPEIVAVKGTVTLDGNPVPEALVEFVPTSGRPSNGITDDKGEYELVYTQTTKGAAAGHHTVKISTGREQITQEGKVIQKAIPEKLPAKYNVTSELTAEVGSDNTAIDFDLQSK